jgi:hypothetical protein
MFLFFALFCSDLTTFYCLKTQFGIPPETIKDSMRLGLAVPNVYIVPVERFCREMGPALGVNLAEFEFPAYFNFFVYKKQCTLIVDNDEAERNIRRVFSETLLGPSKFRRKDNPVGYEEADFDPDFPREAIPNFTKELRHFRIMPDGKELVLETLLNFCHFDTPKGFVHDDIGIPQPLHSDSIKSEQIAEAVDEILDQDSEEEVEQEMEVPKDLEGVESREQAPWTFGQLRFLRKWIVSFISWFCNDWSNLFFLDACDSRLSGISRKRNRRADQATKCKASGNIQNAGWHRLHCA